MVKQQNESKAPGEFGNQGPESPSRRARKDDKEERLQRTKDQAPIDQGGVRRKESADAQGREDLPEGLAPGEPKVPAAPKRDPGMARTSHSEPAGEDPRSKR